MDIIDNELKTEGPPTDDPVDKGGQTAFGISKAANPDMWAHGAPTEAESRQRYEDKYIKWPKFDQVKDTRLQQQLIDFGVNSGPGIAIQKLQEILGVTVDGVIGEETLHAVETSTDNLNTKLVCARVMMIGKIVVKNPTQLKFLCGWLSRALEFI